MDIKVKRGILHILDPEASLPVFSQQELDLSEETVRELIALHAGKIYEDKGVRVGEFEEETPVLIWTRSAGADFMEHSVAVAESLYLLMKKHVEIPGGDLLLAELDIEGEAYLALLKFTYKQGYTHFVEYDESGVRNRIIVQKALFASENQKIDEGALIRMEDFSTRILEKEYPINGEKRSYFATDFMGCQTSLSQKESIRVIRNVAKEMTKKYYPDSIEKDSVVQSVIYDNLEEEGVVALQTVAETTFREDPEIREEYVRKVREKGVDDTVAFSGESPEKAFSKYRIKLDNGIEINVPMEVYRNKESIEFINNSDGTVSVIIKKVRKVTHR